MTPHDPQLKIWRIVTPPTPQDSCLCYLHISDYMINELHWLPVLARVRYKVLLVVAKSQQGLAPKYLCELMSKPLSARSSRPLRSADHCDLVPSSCTSLSQNRAFAVVGLGMSGMTLLLHSGV